MTSSSQRKKRSYAASSVLVLNQTRFHEHFSGRRFLCVFDAERFVIKTKQKLFSSPHLRNHKARQRMSRKQSKISLKMDVGGGEEDWNFRSEIRPRLRVSSWAPQSVSFFCDYVTLSRITVIWLNYNINWNNFPAKLNGMNLIHRQTQWGRIISSFGGWMVLPLSQIGNHPETLFRS